MQPGRAGTGARHAQRQVDRLLACAQGEAQRVPQRPACGVQRIHRRRPVQSAPRLQHAAADRQVRTQVAGMAVPTQWHGLAIARGQVDARRRALGAQPGIEDAELLPPPRPLPDVFRDRQPELELAVAQQIQPGHRQVGTGHAQGGSAHLHRPALQGLGEHETRLAVAGHAGLVEVQAQQARRGDGREIQGPATSLAFGRRLVLGHLRHVHRNIVRTDGPEGDRTPQQRQHADAAIGAAGGHHPAVGARMPAHHHSARMDVARVRAQRPVPARVVAVGLAVDHALADDRVEEHVGGEQVEQVKAEQRPAGPAQAGAVGLQPRTWGRNSHAHSMAGGR
jgi:hypothetical protein